LALEWPGPHQKTVKVLDGALKKWGVEKLLNCVRGGRKAFEDGV
jgi:hypothetical protein